MTKFWAAILAVILLGTAAPAMAEGESYFTRLVIPVVNQGEEMVVLSLDEKITTPGHRYLDKKRAVTLSVNDPARDGLRLEHEHFLIISQVEEGIEPLCRVKLKTANTAGRPGSLLTYCAASSNDERCRLQVYSEAQVCYVLVTVR
ncbi:MAG: hypothetical protein KKC30_05705 [Proteobacteria bacterium]|nr:hypothetical protein [Pseudomonadota bacterium]MBU4276218.1 hypothetical protein [Pseudomonadota bacterium]MBU4384330.1 hypothetical protein [Pseudomonadota bacterium]MBU4606332.1 hypothetical protein [Pseudomonadota bacterium]MCG2764148.1 hypothetical protein [Desulfarculaceae bacterium]